MSRRLLPLLLLMATAHLTADCQLLVYTTRGQVEIQDTSGQWHGASRREKVLPTTHLRLHDNASMELLDTRSGRLYSSTATGTQTVRQLMTRADADAEALVGKANNRLLSASTGMPDDTPRFRTGGISYHQTDASVGAESRTLAEIMAMEDDCSDGADLVLIRREINTEDSTFHFAVFNTLPTPLYINVLSTNTPLDFYLPVNVVVAPMAETLIPQYRFHLPQGRASYAIVGSDGNFSRTDVERLLTTPSPRFHISLLRL